MARRGNSGRQAVPMQADRSQEAGVQQSQGILCAVFVAPMSSQGMSAMAAAIRAAAALCSVSVAACAGTTSVVVIMEMTRSQCRARRAR